MPPTLPQATTNPHLHQRLLDTHGQVWVSLLWGHLSWYTQVLFVPCKSLFPLSCVSSGDSMVGLTATSSKRAYAIPSLLHPEPCPSRSPLLTHTSTGYTQTQFCLSLCGISGSWCTQGLFEPSEHLWWVWGLILNAILLLLLSCWGFSTLDMGYLLILTPAPDQ